MLASHIRQAAILLDSLPIEAAHELSLRLSPHELCAVRAEMARLQAISRDERAAALSAFIAAATDGASQRARVCAESRPMGDLADLGAAGLLPLVAGEHPQAIAFVLSRLPAPLSADVLAQLPAEVQSAVSRRLATIGPVDPDIARQVERALEERAAQLAVRRTSDVTGETTAQPAYGSQRLVA